MKFWNRFKSPHFVVKARKYILKRNMSTLLNDFIKGNRYFFESSNKDIHGVEKSDISKLYQDRQWELTWFIKNEGLTFEDLNFAFSEQGDLSEVQKKHLAEVLLLSSTLDSPNEIIKDTIDNFLLSNEVGSKALESAPKLKEKLLEVQSDATRNSISTRAMSSNLKVIEEYSESQFLINNLKSFVAIIGDEEKDLLELKNTNKPINALRNNDVGELKQLVTKLSKEQDLSDKQKEDLLSKLSSVDVGAFHSAPEAKDAINKIAEHMKNEADQKLSNIVEKSNFSNNSAFVHQTLVTALSLLNQEGEVCQSLVKRAQDVNHKRELLPQKQELEDELQPQIVLGESGQTISIPSDSGIIMGRIQREDHLRRNDVDYGKKISLHLLEQGLILRKLQQESGKFDKLSSFFSKREADEGLDRLLEVESKAEPPQPTSMIKGLLKKTPLIGSYIKDDTTSAANLLENKEVLGTSELVDKDGNVLLTMSNDKSLFDAITSQEPSFRVNYKNKGAMDPQAHKFAALKAMEAGIERPHIILPSKKGVSDEQKLEFYKSNLRALLDAGYKPDAIEWHRGENFLMSSSLKDAMKEAKSQISMEYAADQTALSLEEGAIVGEDMLAELENLEQHESEALVAQELLENQRVAELESLNASLAQTVEFSVVEETNEGQAFALKHSQAEHLDLDSHTQGVELQEPQGTSDKPSEVVPKYKALSPKGT